MLLFFFYWMTEKSNIYTEWELKSKSKCEYGAVYATRFSPLSAQCTFTSLCTTPAQLLSTFLYFVRTWHRPLTSAVVHAVTFEITFFLTPSKYLLEADLTFGSILMGCFFVQHVVHSNRAEVGCVCCVILARLFATFKTNREEAFRCMNIYQMMFRSRGTVSYQIAFYQTARHSWANQMTHLVPNYARLCEASSMFP